MLEMPPANITMPPMMHPRSTRQPQPSPMKSPVLLFFGGGAIGAPPGGPPQPPGPPGGAPHPPPPPGGGPYPPPPGIPGGPPGKALIGIVGFTSATLSARPTRRQRGPLERQIRGQ